MKQKLIVFSVMFVVYGVIMALQMMTTTQQWLNVSLLSAFIFALLTTIILSIVQGINLKRTGQSGAIIKVHVELQLEIEASKHEAFLLCTEALKDLKKCTIGLSNSKKGVITATTGVNWLTWGEDLSVVIEEQDEDTCIITLSSRPKVKTTLIDYGKSRDNIVNLVNYISQTPHSITPIRDETKILKQGL